MKPSDLIDAFVASKRLENRMSARSEESYRPVLEKWVR